MKCEWHNTADCMDDTNCIIHRCPKNTDDSCNLIPAKREPQLVRVKAWARTIDWEVYAHSSNCLSKYPKGYYNKPCFILINEKYLQARKIR